MSGDTYHFGDSVTMNGGRGNIGMIKNQGASAPAEQPSPELEAAVRELVALVRELRASVPAASAQAIDDTLPDITADPAAPPQERHRALMAVAGIAATVGAVGQPVIEAVNRILELLG
ncbi:MULTISPECIES: hypothetical protein [unclassified Streptomyces]|uniref:hypothetical protein n=1 Tax=unclassified Streptomyces TaxID=2593676 RepID=UPI0001D06B34|nr:MULTISPECIES: hypothetical protein [unclassified Streptomyces]EFF92453.1 hypothetical protein SSTG_02772 [Streptomyces sp. e14]MYS44538.1 hypothetical protein [Streptomyces sp. SID5998]MYX28047.1 hypothetical protein [Streptomyces sp. SID8381]